MNLPQDMYNHIYNMERTKGEKWWNPHQPTPEKFYVPTVHTFSTVLGLGLCLSIFNLSTSTVHPPS